MEEPISLHEAARQFGVKVDRLRRAAWDGRLATRKVGNQRLVTPGEVGRFLRDGRRRSAPTQPDVSGTAERGARVITVAMPKSGTGKTTTTLNLGTALAEQGQRVLLVDFDPQSDLTQSLGLQSDGRDHSVYSAIKYFLTCYEPQLEAAICTTTFGVDLVPASARLHLAPDELSVAVQRELVLDKLLAPLLPRYDIVLIDTLPYLGILLLNALVAAHEVLMPLQTDQLATEPLLLLLAQIELIRRSRLNPRLTLTGVLLTMVDPQAMADRDMLEAARRIVGSRVPVCETVVPRSLKVPKVEAQHGPMLSHDPSATAVVAYRALAREILDAGA